MNSTDELPKEAWTVALLSLPGLGPSRLGALLAEDSAPEVWQRLVKGQFIRLDLVPQSTIDQWRTAARAMSVVDHWGAIGGLGITVSEHGSTGYPARLQEDIEPPRVLFSLGDPMPTGPTVGIVGTRKCTAYGQRCAFELGAALADAGVSVVSGLALGIDAAAHRGALSHSHGASAPVIGVVGSGLDVIYPKHNAGLWAEVASRGTLLSETPPGVGPEKWRFPARNRIIAGLSDAMIVVESHERGGSLLTVDEAQTRDIPVGAVPGPITSNAAAGSNRLLVDGATPVLEVSDVLAMIGHSPPRVMSDDFEDMSSELLDALGWTPLSFEQLSSRTSLPASEVALELERLVSEGLCARSGPWIERVR